MRMVSRSWREGWEHAQEGGIIKSCGAFVNTIMVWLTNGDGYSHHTHTHGSSIRPRNGPASVGWQREWWQKCSTKEKKPLASTFDLHANSFWVNLWPSREKKILPCATVRKSFFMGESTAQEANDQLTSRLGENLTHFLIFSTFTKKQLLEWMTSHWDTFQEKLKNPMKCELAILLKSLWRLLTHTLTG